MLAARIAATLVNLLRENKVLENGIDYQPQSKNQVFKCPLGTNEVCKFALKYSNAVVHFRNRIRAIDYSKDKSKWVIAAYGSVKSIEVRSRRCSIR